MNNKPIFATDCFRVKVGETANLAVRKSQEQAVASFERFLGDSSVTLDDFNGEVLDDWVSWLFYNGYSCATVMTYVSRLSALYGKTVKAGWTNDNGCFIGVKEKLNNARIGGIEVTTDPECFRKLQKLVHTDFSNSPERQLAKDLVLFAIYNGGLTFKQLAEYKKTDYAGKEVAIMEIGERYSKPKNKYLFPLKQSVRTTNQLHYILSDLFADALGMVGIKLSEYDSATAIDLWAMVAMKGNIPTSEIRACIGDDLHVNPIFSFASRAELTDERRQEIQHYVIDLLTKDPYNWYAMQFRPHVNYDMVSRRLQERGIQLKNTFYPMEEIVKRVGKKMLTQSRPIVNGLLFFQCKATELQNLFLQIGDLAWGYRQTRTARGQYAIISPTAIETYQLTIGKFTSDMDIYPSGTIQLKEGDQVEIIGGELMGRTAEFEKEINDSTNTSNEPKRIIYRLKLIGDNAFEWAMNIDARFVSPVS